MKIFLLLMTLLLATLCLCNRKVNILRVIKSQFTIFKNDKINKTSFYDICCFFIFPTFIATMLVVLIPIDFILNSSELFILILSIISTILFSFLSLLLGRKNEQSQDSKINQVSKQTFIAIIMTIIYSVCTILLMIILMCIGVDSWISYLLNGFVVYFSCKIVLYMLMILKRMFLLL